MDIYNLVTESAKALRRNNKINSLNIRSIVQLNKDDSVLLVCDTEDGILSSTEPWIGFKVLIPCDVFESRDLPLDEEANVSPSANFNIKIAIRISYYIFKAYKDAKKQISK